MREPPRIADDAFVDAQLRFIEQFALVDVRPADDHVKHTLVLRRAANVADTGLEFLPCEISDFHVVVLHFQIVNAHARQLSY
jgi:hypothetical protein